MTEAEGTQAIDVESTSDRSDIDRVVEALGGTVIKNIAVFCSATENLDEKYADLAKQVGDLMNKRGYGLVWGGSDVGLMAVISRRIQKGGGSSHGVSVEFLEHERDRQNPRATSMRVADNLGERMSMMLDASDAVLVIPGGVGTFLEVLWVAEHKRHELHAKPAVVINIDGFYDPLIKQLNIMEEAGMLHNWSAEDMIHFCDNADEAFGYIDRMFAENGAPGDAKIGLVQPSEA